ncbi:DUF342 domain-containing protein [Vallitalea okinawensis]|uniref:DUF342 domain-containing protein n=1 Tax=Vallitalea okinawensis TaxID=2078660 RepID=UPI000CFD89D6|nr:FapA family protein [Vallitalea okinawensis]
MKDSIQLSISQDNLLATLIVLPPVDEEEITFEHIEEVICESGIVFGIDLQVIEQLKQEIILNQAYEIAHGEVAKNGIDGKIIYEFNTNKLIKPSLLDDGSVDFHNLNLINNVKQGDVIVRIQPEQEGEEGTDIYGEAIQPPPVKKAILPKHGPNISTSDGGKTLVSDVEGHVDLIYDKVVVNEVLTINGNVDHATGDVNYNGSIMVTGNVLSGFSVKAKKNIEVLGLVEGATLLAGGNIVIRGGVQGMDKARVICNGSLVVKYISNAFVKANAAINTNSILHSEVSCNDVIIVNGKGLISGGKVQANREISTKVIGTSMGTKTFIEVGVDPDIMEKYHEFKEKKSQLEDEIKKLKQIIKVLEDRRQKGIIKPDRIQVLEKSHKTLEKLIKESKAAENIVMQLLPLIENVREGKIRAATSIYPGTVATIGSQSLVIRNQLDRCTLVLEGGEVRVAAF